ncbi:MULTISPECIES: hypothetical protein [Paraburkholderia]|uniref:hypothetical protein n=1 Tax=Paraburkholderia TaxID=1822464 RepID=UPI0038B811DD
MEQERNKLEIEARAELVAMARNGEWLRTDPLIEWIRVLHPALSKQFMGMLPPSVAFGRNVRAGG